MMLNAYAADIALMFPIESFENVFMHQLEYFGNSTDFSVYFLFSEKVNLFLKAFRATFTACKYP
jgi:hypothetical protein